MSTRSDGSESFKMSAGEYYIGDLCYVLGDRWDEVCKLTLTETVNEGIFELNDGTEFLLFGTAYGDGCYQDEEGHMYGVDAGLIGAVLVKSISESEKKSLNLGHIHSFDKPWTAYNDGGDMHFGDVHINTKDEEDDEYEDEEEGYYQSEDEE